jgi:hypothetical protein
VGGDPLAELKPYIAELRVPEGSKLVDTRLRDLEADAAKADVALIGVVRDGRRRYGTGRNLKLAAGDVLVIEADPAALDEFRAGQNLETPKAASGAGAVGDGVTLVEAVVPDRRAHRGQDGGGRGPRLAAEHDADGHRAAGAADHEIPAQDGDRAGRHPAAPRARGPRRGRGVLARRHAAGRPRPVGHQETKTWAAIAVFAAAVTLAAWA